MECYYSPLVDIKKLCSKAPDYVRIKKGKHALVYIQYYCGFDIETTNIYADKTAFMYHWQFGLNTHTIYGRTWGEFVEFIDRLSKQLKLNEHRRLIVWIANEGFEFQFMRKHLNITTVFARAKREPLLAVHDERVEFRDCLPISGGNLDYLAKHYTSIRKAKGDLDYTILRNSQTPLDEKELGYCRIDVRILVEWSRYIFETYIIKENYIPMTKTGILRHRVKEGVNDDIKGFVMRAFPSQKLYDVMMKWLFRGGFTHANMWYVNETITAPINGYDFTSSYPAIMLQYNKFPMSKLTLIPSIHTLDDLDKIPPRCPYFIAVRFYGIESRTYHSIESSFKCKRLEGREFDENGEIIGEPLIDNGRVSKAAIMSVYLTDVDLKIYELFYKWDKAEVFACYYAAGGRLPAYLRDPLADLYYTKARLKKAGLEDTTEYVESKKAINAAYGMTVQRVYLDDTKYTEGRRNDKGKLEEWYEESNGRSWYRIVKGQFLLPQWGIWVTAVARYRLLSTVAEVEAEATKDENEGEGGAVVYCDTDSLYMVNHDRYKHIIERYNERIYEINAELFPDMPEFADLGEFDLINKKAHNYYAFKTLGAKRYIKTQKLIVNNRVYDAAGKTEVTVAGLPKTSLQRYCADKKVNIYDVFTEGMTMDLMYSHKNAHSYNDEPTSANINGEIMTELSSVCIYPTTFKLSWAAVYKLLLDEITERRKNIEKYVH